ncbi:MAG: molybdopterin-dependent oxidoreductase [Chloroflexota bacterium]
MTAEPRVSGGAWRGALAGIAAGAAALGASELFAGLVAGAPSPIVAIGDLVVALQPAGAKQLVVDLFGEADKLLLNLLIGGVALAIAAALGIIALRQRGAALVGFGIVACGAAAASLRDAQVEPLFAIVSGALGTAIAAIVLARLLDLAGARVEQRAEMPDWSRRRFIGTSLAVGGVAAAGGLFGRTLLDLGRAASPAAAAPLPAPASSVPPLPAGAGLDVAGISSIVTPNDAFYRIDTALLLPRVDPVTWRLRFSGMVDRPYELTYDELVAMPLSEQYVTIACVSNEVGGDLVGNARWGGVPLRTLLDRAGVQPSATQLVGRSQDGWTAGFPTAWLDEPDREAMVVLSMNGEPLPTAHGFPARLIVPGLYGYVSATKWLTEIELTTLEAFDAYWIPLGWAKEGPIKTQSRIDTPRHRSRIDAGPVAVAGVAWAPDRGISAVELQVDEGPWQTAELSVPISDATWVQWVVRWTATSGDHVIRVRATDATGTVQTAEIARPDPDGATGLHTIALSVA